MSTMSDLPEDLVGEIFSRVPLTSLIAVRSTCKNWNALSKIQILGKRATTSKKFLGFMLMSDRVCSMKFNLQGINNNYGIVDLSINEVSVFDEVEISKVFHCHGLLLCVTKHNPRLVVWNPYLGQTRWIKPYSFSKNDMYGLGYDKNNDYHKILRFCCIANCLFFLDIYDYNSNSWRVLDVTLEWDIIYYQSIMSMNGNTYFLARGFMTKDIDKGKTNELSLLSFDYTAERFGPLPLPFQSYSYGSESVTLSCVRDEKLVLLHEYCVIMDFWITTKIDPNSVSWSKFLKVDKISLSWFPSNLMARNFFIDEAQKKVVVVSSFRKSKNTFCCQTVYVIGEDGYIKSVDIGETRIRKHGYHDLVVFSPYVPSSVQLKES